MLFGTICSMAQNERSLMVTSDLDGVQFHAPIPLGTTKQLLRGQLHLPGENEVFKPHLDPVGLWAVALSRLNTIFHEYRPVDKMGKAGLDRFKEVAEENNIDLTLAALTGRDGYMHTMTRRRLDHHGYGQYFDRYYLSDVKNSAGYKRRIVKELLQEDETRTVVHLEDDLRAALLVASTNPDRVLVYLKKNFSNRPFLLRRAKVTLPPNVVLVDDFVQAVEDYKSRIAA